MSKRYYELMDGSVVGIDFDDGIPDPDPLRPPETDDEPWTVPILVGGHRWHIPPATQRPEDPEPRSLTVLRIVTVVLVLVVVALVARR